jgi:tetratricopeptide (TPR) repeat protein
MVASALEEGPRPVEECIELCQGLERSRGVDNPGVLSSLALLWAMKGDFDKARHLVDTARRVLRETVRARRPLGRVVARAGDVELLAGEVMAAEEKLREALEINLEMGENVVISEIAAKLSRALVAKGDIDGAERFAEVSEGHAPSQSVTTQALWRSTRSRTLALRGDLDEAVPLAREAADLVPAEMLNLRADVLADLAEVLLRAGQSDSAAAAIRGATDLYRRKGNRVNAARVAAIGSSPRSATS